MLITSPYLTHPHVVVPVDDDAAVVPRQPLIREPRQPRASERICPELEFDRCRPGWFKGRGGRRRAAGERRQGHEPPRRVRAAVAVAARPLDRGRRCLGRGAIIVGHTEGRRRVVQVARKAQLRWATRTHTSLSVDTCRSGAALISWRTCWQV